MNTIVYNLSNNKTIKKEYWEQESYPLAIDSCCLVSVAKNNKTYYGQEQVQIPHTFRGMEHTILGTEGNFGADCKTRVHYEEEDTKKSKNEKKSS